MGTVLPAEHRRLRHVLQFACRHAPVLSSNSGSSRRSTTTAALSNTLFTLRDVNSDGSPGGILYESEVREGTVHPLWAMLPPSLTLETHPNVRKLVFSLYRVAAEIAPERAAAAAGIQTASTKGASYTTNGGRANPRAAAGCDSKLENEEMRIPVSADALVPGECSDMDGVAPLEGQTPTPTTVEDVCKDVPTAEEADDVAMRPRSRGQSLSELNAEPSVLMVRRDSVSTGGLGDSKRQEDDSPRGMNSADPIPMEEDGSKPTTRNTASNEECVMHANDNDHSNAQKKQLIFECLMDFTKTEFLSKHFSGLHDIGLLPAHMDDGSRSFTILVRCHDGIFFPTMEASIGGTGTDLDLSRPTPSTYGMSIASKMPNFGGGSTFLQHNNQFENEWDFVDGDAAREAEARQQKTESMSLGDVKVFGSSSIALQRMLAALKSCADERRQHIDKALDHERSGAVISAVRSAVTAVTTVTCASLIKDRRAQIEALQKSIASRREALDARRHVLSAPAVAEAPHPSAAASPSPHSADDDAKVRLQQLRRRLATQVVEWFQVAPAANTILGVKLPSATTEGGGLPETAEHAMSISHVCHAVVVFSRIFNVSLPHPIHFAAPGRCRVYERQGAALDKFFPLYPVKNSERTLLRRGMDLLRQNIVAAAYSIHSQRQADGLPLALATEKLLLGR